MTEENIEKLKKAGIDYDTALQRFMGSEAMMEKFLKKFLNDPSYDELKAACKAGDNDAAFGASHNMNGVCSNFSMTRLQQVSSDACECFRAGDLAGGAAMLPAITAEYEGLVAAIKEVF